ncbi:MAG TPA: site-specific DNA-methyltransferase, partial [Chromatiales bacterium]|nr:site-specific DNA-methyltransferase [Chromatiales bacterium]
MTELVFKGKEFVYNHHLAVPTRPLEPRPEKSVGDVSLDGNLIIHGDNLHALKALLPHYAGKVDCVFIDPPYNTGNEGWVYNDNVNAPMIKEWLGKEVGLEDGLRHDKWCAMMWPRLRLLHELLAETGSFWMTLDDNEVHRARMMLDEIFGEENFVATICWKKKTNGNNVGLIPPVHDYVIVYAKRKNSVSFNMIDEHGDISKFSNPDNDPRGPWKTQDLSANHKGPYFPIVNPETGEEHYPAKGRYWVFNEEEVIKRI